MKYWLAGEMVTRLGDAGAFGWIGLGLRMTSG